MMYGQPPPPPNYVMLGNQYGVPPPPYYQPQPYPHRRAIPRYETRRSGCGYCLKCICCCYCLLFMFIFLIAASLFLTYTFYKPKIPIYKLEDFSVTNFTIQPDFSVTTGFLVTVRAENPNTRIGFIYGENSSISVSFDDSILCKGKLPSFHQGHENVTMIKIQLAGKSPFGSGLNVALKQGDKQGSIPLLIQVKAPITIVMDKIPLRQFVFYVDCHMVVDHLNPDKKPKILSNTYTFGIGY